MSDGNGTPGQITDDQINELAALLHEFINAETFYGKQLPATYDHHPSMLQDLQAGKPTEIDALNGAVVRLASEHGVAVPVNRTLVGMVRFLESKGAAVIAAP